MLIKKNKKIVGLAKSGYKPKMVIETGISDFNGCTKVYPEKEVIEIKVMKEVEPQPIGIELTIVDNNITQEDIYEKLKNKYLNKGIQQEDSQKLGHKNMQDRKDTKLKSVPKKIKIVNKKSKEDKALKNGDATYKINENGFITVKHSLKELSLKDDIFFKIRATKNFDGMWEPLDSQQVKPFFGFCKDILRRNQLNFKISNRIIEILKLYSFIKQTEENEFKKYKIKEETFYDILCVCLYEETMNIQEQNLLPYYIITPAFKTYVYGKKIQELYNVYYKIKNNINKFDINNNVINNKNLEPIKWLLFDSTVCIEKILELSLGKYIKETIMESFVPNNNGYKSNILIGMINNIKRLSLIQYNLRSNLEHSLMSNRIRKIRNALSRTHSKLFYGHLENTVKSYLSKVREDKIHNVTLQKIRKLEIGDILFQIDSGKKISEFLIYKKGKNNARKN